MGDHTTNKIHPVSEVNIKSVAPPPHASSSLRHHLRPPSPPPQMKAKRGFSCCKCLCWSLSILITLIIIIGATIGILYLVFKPKIPQYSVDRLTISQLTLNLDFSLYARFNVQITAINPNKKIGIYYQKGSRLSVWYKNTNLCQGSLPVFYQGHQNKTVLNVALAGQNQYGRTLLAAIQEQQQTGRIPLDLKVDVPVKIELGKLKLMKVRILGNCMLIVDSLSTNNKISIKATSCKFRLKL
ncbi:putative Late embryogenesis abundant protein [Helianthus annuus]|uniref:Late embryogenesis abundant protein, LEA_2 subgroup n=1 Tax=Helianthus annuus TaxID=4232 RepID=A0A251S5Y8_HELAN|nr:NDR1/HIN1-like protein 6 [Helianthus annuus]KAF5763229.1 putative Late embryogenesis abundant protein, LEA_2 subgroup [Helianthus annuus]KAJ0450129.1 putative Late embryogenesis abundant protein [Helianthus annuus]KAJ0471913.1 putative Late embryogenesis abundant protein [Helianthus annuus]KAJ0647519.1 putative Late embryogenesis abundant protein [Helianthus annuus]KAJ0651395.1 putative Late embryogenesis abundant protein [Helianthus annuus]